MNTIAARHGFAVVSTRPLPELGAQLLHLRHERTKLELVWLNRPEENKTFAIGFETLPEDDTGIFHILEHSVLCGSDNYPVKEPFVELLKSSLNTFLNAMTFPDKTVYPVSSRNGQDYLNLMRVYLDAVFHPLIYTKPEIFYQEGWHYELDENGAPGYKGVVFNEMKGALSSADEQMRVAVNRRLFPESPYRFVSGGDPACIPDLSYEQFIGGHRRFYSPSNAYVVLDGAVDLDAVLSILDDEYLKNAVPTERMAPPVLQKPVDGGEQAVEYEISAEEPLDDRYRLALCGTVGTFADRETVFAAQLLADALCGTNHSPLSEVILSKGLAEAVTMQVQDGMLQPTLALEVTHFRRENKDEIEALLHSEIARLADEGLDRAALKAAMANMEFQLRERDYGAYPQGLGFAFGIYESWLYGGDPAANLEVGDFFLRLSEKLEQGWFEQLLRTLLLENPHCCKVLLIPSHSAGEARRAQESARLARESAAWSAETRASLAARQRALDAWQKSEDTPEALAKMPRLTLADLAEAPERRTTEALCESGVTVWHHAVQTSGIVYMNLYFDADFCTEAQLSRLSFLATLLGETATSAHTAQQLDVQQKLLCGMLQCSVESYAGEQNAAPCGVKLHVSFSALERNAEAALRLVCEILTDTRFEEEQSALDLLRQTKTMRFRQIVMGGAAAAMGRTVAQLSAAGVVSECTGGVEYYRWLAAEEKAWNWNAQKAELSALLGRVVNKNALTLSVTGMVDSAPFAALAAALLPAAAAQAPVVYAPWGIKKEGIAIPSDIAFAARGASLAAYGGAYSGQAVVAARIVSLACLWNTIRVQGGAYGTGLRVWRTSFAACYSYRDPNAARSLAQYLGAAAFLRDFCKQGVDLTGFIIGAVSDASPLLTPRMKGVMADMDCLTGRTWQRQCTVWQQLLHTTPETLLAFADALEPALENGGICVIGAKGQLEACAELTEITTL